MCILTAESASQSDVEIEMSATSLTINAKLFSSACLALSLSFDLYHDSACPSFPPPFSQQFFMQ